MGHYLNPKYFTYVDTISTDKFVYPVNVRDLAASLGISREELFQKKFEDIDIKETFFDCIPNHVLKKIQHGDVNWNSFIPKCEEQLYDNLRRK